MVGASADVKIVGPRGRKRERRSSVNYQSFLKTKQVVVAPSLPRWAGCGPWYNAVNANPTAMRGVWGNVLEVQISVKARLETLLLLKGLFGQVEAPRIGAVLCALRLAFLPALWRARHRGTCQSVLFAHLLHGVARNTSQPRHVPENWNRSYSPCNSRGGSRKSAAPRGSCSPQRLEQAKQSSVKPRCFPGSSHACKLSSGRNL